MLFLLIVLTLIINGIECVVKIEEKEIKIKTEELNLELSNGDVVFYKPNENVIRIFREGKHFQTLITNYAIMYIENSISKGILMFKLKNGDCQSWQLDMTKKGERWIPVKRIL